MSRTIRKLTQLDQNRDKSSFSKTLNGLIVVAGDFNSDQHSVAARLLSHGYTNHGNIRDRNYSAKITKASAKDMNHPYRFIDVYENSGGFGNSRNDPRFKHNTLRELYAPVTVSLKGRGPGIMDHLFYATVSSSSKILGKQYRTPSKLVNEKKNMQQLSTTSTKTGTVDLTTKPSSPTFLSNNLSSGKRRKRRDKAKSRFGGTASTARVSNNDPKIYIDSILATIRCDGNDVDDKNDKGDERLRIIYEGLPNLKEGFPSDHLPVGALLSTVPAIKYDSEQTKDDVAPASILNNENINDTYTQGRVEKARGITSTVERRRRNSQASYGLRRRHNLVLNAITEWLVGLGASSVVLDKPLYKNKLLSRTMGGAKPLQQHIKRKSRAPDLMCIIVDDNDNDNDDRDDNTIRGGVLVVVEVAVAADPEKVREQKISKYQDLVTAVTNHGQTCNRCHLCVIIVQDDGVIPAKTQAAIESLAKLSLSSSSTMNNTKASSSAIEEETERFSAHLRSLVSSLQVQ